MKKLITTGLLALGLSFATNAEASTLHTVQSGDTLYKLGKKYNIDYSYIYKSNNLTSTTLQISQSLKIPTKYVVKGGDTLYKLSKQYGVTIDSIRQVNNKWNTNLLSIGEVLYIADGVQGKPTEPTQPVPQQTTKRATLNAADMDLFARLVYAESVGQPFEGQVAVAEVVLNRVDSPDFPNTVREVIYETYEDGSIPAFSPVANGAINNTADDSARNAVEAAINGSTYAKGALFFYNPAKTSEGNWIRSREIVALIGDHVFAK